MKVVTEKPLARNKALLEEILQELLKCRYFQTMGVEILREVLRKGTHLSVPSGTTLIREAELDDDLFFLLSGSLKVMSGDKLVLRLNEPGDVVGELAVVSDSPRAADVVTEVASRLVRVSSASVKTAPTDPRRAVQVLTVFAHIMAAKLRETTRRARLYEDSVLEAQEMATSHTRLESEIAERLKEVLLYSKVVESSSEGMIITSHDGMVQRFNPAAEHLLPALTRRRGRGALKLQDLVKSFSRPAFPPAPLTAPWHGEWVKEREGEDPFVLQVSVTPVAGQDGALLNVAYQLHDVSLHKAQERAIARKNEEIQRTLLDLEATYQELQRSDRLKTETLSVISAELSGPIRKVINHAGKLTQSIGELSPEQAQNELAAIQEQGEYLKIVAENIGNLI